MRIEAGEESPAFLCSKRENKKRTSDKMIEKEVTAGVTKEETRKKKNEALIMYKKGKKLVEIAQTLGVPAGTIRRWKCEDGWDGERSARKSERSEKKKQKPIKEEKREKARDLDITEKRELFCLYYAKYRNKVKAYQKAFGCSYETACGNASNLSKNIDVKARIDELLRDLHENIEFSIQDIAQKQIDIATADIKDFVNLDDGVVVLRDADEIDGTLIKSIKNTKFGIEVQLKDSQKALEWLTTNRPKETKATENRIEITKRKERPDGHMDTTVQAEPVYGALGG